MRILSRIAAAATLAAAAYAGLPASPAGAATCSSADGVSVVVDFHELGGGVRTACVAGGGGDTAASLFPAAGFPLSYVQRQPSFVCRVSGAPADDPCVNTPPADAYWALFWSDGTSGSWTYATTGVGSLKIPDGGYVAFSWNGSSARSTPGVAPTPHAATAPTPTQAPTKAPTHGATPGPSHTGSGSGPSSNASDSASPSAGASDDPSATPDPAAGKGRRKSGRGSASGSAEPSPTAEASAPADEATSVDAAPVSAEAVDPGDSDDPGLPSWVAPVAIVALFAAAGGAALARRRRTARP